MTLTGSEQHSRGSSPMRWSDLPFLSHCSRLPAGRFGGGDIAIVIAHPDDETIGGGALLARLEGAAVILITDGAPRNLDDARAHGFETAEAYGRQRLSEMRRALGHAGVGVGALVALGLPDQGAAFHLREIALQLADIFRVRGTRSVLTHAYEGGHPDHDAAAFAVSLAVRLAASRGQDIGVVEMPFYRLGESGVAWQSFAPDKGAEWVVKLDPEERLLKLRMMAAHDTQKAVLTPFEPSHERFRAAPRHDFRELPNGGRLNYERYAWGISGERWRSLVSAALAEMTKELN